jgi:hypothetical protein
MTVGWQGSESKPIAVFLFLLLLVFICGLLRRRCARRGWCRRRGVRSRPHARLSQQTLMIALVCFQHQFDFGVRGQRRHALIVNVVVLTESISFLQIRWCSLRKRHCRLHCRIVYRLVFQLSPFLVQPQFISLRAQRSRLLKGLIKLRYLWQLGAIGRFR